MKHAITYILQNNANFERIYLDNYSPTFDCLGDGTFTFEEFVAVMANMGGISEHPEEDEEEELRQAFKVEAITGVGAPCERGILNRPLI